MESIKIGDWKILYYARIFLCFSARARRDIYEGKFYTREEICGRGALGLWKMRELEVLIMNFCWIYASVRINAVLLLGGMRNAGFLDIRLFKRKRLIKIFLLALVFR